MRAPRNNAYASITHWTSVIVAWRSACSAGSATLTTVASMNVMLDPRMVAPRTHRFGLLSFIVELDHVRSTRDDGRRDFDQLARRVDVTAQCKAHLVMKQRR